MHKTDTQVKAVDILPEFHVFRPSALSGLIIGLQLFLFLSLRHSPISSSSVPPPLRFAAVLFMCASNFRV